MRTVGQEATAMQLGELEKYRRMLDNLPVGIYRINPNGKVLEANRKFAELLGYKSVQELKAVNVNDFYVSQSDRAAFVEKLRNSDLTAEFELRRKDRTTIWVRDYPKATISLNGYITHLDGVFVETHGIDAITRDIGEDKRLDMRRMREQFISSVTHELRTPLVSIKGYVDYILAMKDGSVPDSIRPSLEIIKRNTDRLFTLVNDLLDVQRIESGKFRLKLETFNLREILGNCIEEMAPVLKQKKQKIHVDAPAATLNIQGDRLRLTEVFTNLLNNAAKFTPDSGEIYVRVEEENDSIRISVRDTGIGIDKMDLERVFEPFAAIEKPTYIKGTGLGLSLAKRLVEVHGGKMWVDSPGKGQGATIAFTLPKRREEPVRMNG
jgi:PAS domain S-box-containing protein